MTRFSSSEGLLTSLLLLLTTAFAMADTPPNVVVIFIDDMGYGDIGPFGNTANPTPNLDRMAAEGNVLTNYYVSNTACTPSRSALLTGTYAHRIGMDEIPNFLVVFPGDTRGLNPDEVTIAEMLKTQSYATGCFGKWHLGDQPQYMPLAQGFDEYFGIPYSNDMWSVSSRTNPVTNGPYEPLPVMRGTDPVAYVSDGSDQSLMAEVFTDEAISFIENHQNEPFFVYLPHSYVHSPQFARPDILAAAGGDAKRANIMEVDTSVGRVLDKLVELELDTNTLVLFTSDNGPANGFSAGPLRGRKGGDKYEGHMRVPTIAWWPGRIPAGAVTNEIAATIDLLPSLAALTGASVPTDRTIDGLNSLDVLLGVPAAVSPHTELYYEDQAIRQGKWKYLNINGGELYDLEVDIGESNNLAGANPGIVSTLSDLLATHNASVASDTRPAGNDADAVPILTAVGDLPTLSEYLGESAPESAPVSWSAAVLTGESDVSTNGTGLEALNFSGGMTASNFDTTINEVTFNGLTNGAATTVGFANPTATYFSSNSQSVVAANDDKYTSPPGLAQFDPLLSQWLYGNASGQTVVLNGLSDGNNYEVQLFMGGTEGLGGDNRYIVIDDGTPNAFGSATTTNFGADAPGPDDPAANPAGIVITGTFTATSPSQSFTITNYRNSTPPGSPFFLNAYQLREIEAPKPGPALRLRFEEGADGAGTPGEMPSTSGHLIDSVAGNNGTASEPTSRPAYLSDVFGSEIPLTLEANALALDFERNEGDRVNVPYNAAFSFGSDPWTIEAWVKRESTSGTQFYIVGKKDQAGTDGAGLEWGFYFDNLGRLNLKQGDGSAIFTTTSSLALTDTGTWHHVSVALDPGTASHSVRFTLDGVVDTVATSTAYTPLATQQGLLIGNHINGAGGYDGAFDGLIDELRISRGFLPVSQLLNAPGAGEIRISRIDANLTGGTVTIDFTGSGLYDVYRSPDLATGFGGLPIREDVGPGIGVLIDDNPPDPRAFYLLVPAEAAP